MAIVCLMTMVVFSSCGNIEEDGNAAIEKYEKWSKECAKSNAEENAEDAISCLKSNRKLKESEINKMFARYDKEVEADANKIVSRCFDPLFQKYGERRVVEWINNKANEETYRDFKLSSKEEFYDHFKAVITSNYDELYKVNFDLKFSEYKIELLKKRF